LDKRRKKTTFSVEEGGCRSVSVTKFERDGVKKKTGEVTSSSKGVGGQEGYEGGCDLRGSAGGENLVV